MSSDRVIRVASIACKFDSKASASCDFVSLHSSKELSTLTSKHRTNDELNATLSVGDIG
jgi:hypothetical protein